MSQTMHNDARLYGYDGPVFPADVISDLNAKLDQRNVTGESLKRVGRQMPGFGRIIDPETSDGYVWFWSFLFRPKTGYSEVLVAIPWAQDRNRTDGVRLDRSIAVYTKGNGTPEQLHAILTELISCLHDMA